MKSNNFNNDIDGNKFQKINDFTPNSLLQNINVNDIIKDGTELQFQELSLTSVLFDDDSDNDDHVDDIDKKQFCNIATDEFDELFKFNKTLTTETTQKAQKKNMIDGDNEDDNDNSNLNLEKSKCLITNISDNSNVKDNNMKIINNVNKENTKYPFVYFLHEK